MKGEGNQLSVTGVLTRKFSSSSINISNLMEKKLNTLKRSFSFKSLTSKSSEKQKFSFRRTPSRKLDIYFPYIRGPDVKPPRNERRTLKLSKSDEQGFGFWLQTYGFGKKNAQKRTFVRYVEDEGPAYLAGLREGDVIVEVDGKNVQEIDHMKIVEYITEAKKQLILVVKFMDAVRRVELAVRLKKREAKLKLKMELLEKLKEDEKLLLSGASTSAQLESWSIDLNPNNENNEFDNISLNTSTESELSSISSLSSEDVIVRTSKFEKRSSRVLDSIKELNCAGAISNARRTNLTSVTTENDLLNVYSDSIERHDSVGRSRLESALKRVELTPTQKYMTLPRYKAVIDLDGNFAREYSIENSTTGHISSENFHDPYSKHDLSDDADDDNSADESTPNLGLSRRNRQSYKQAIRLKLDESGSMDL